MLAMRALLIVLTLFSFAACIAAQTIQPCTQISIDSVEKIDPGVALVFLAKNDTSLGEVKYKWTISLGTIMSGQDSLSIVVDTAGLGGQLLKATVEVAGPDWRCSVKSKAVEITPPIGCGMAFDQYGDIRFEDEKARLDNFAIQLMNLPSARGAMIALAGNPTYKGEAAFRLQRAKNYLVNVRKIAPNRLVTTDAGYRADLTIYFWVMPDGASLPVVESTVPLSEVRFTKRPPSQLRRGTKPRR